MKPCSRNQKQIAWLAVNALDAREAEALREHIAQCDGCRRYWQEVSNVTEQLATARLDSNLEASAQFHRRVAEKLKATEPNSILENFAAWLRGSMLTWRVALPTTVVIVFFVMIALQRGPVTHPPTPLVTQNVPSSEIENATTVAHYQMVASQSLEKLDELLVRQGSKPLPPLPADIASGRDLARASF